MIIATPKEREKKKTNQQPIKDKITLFFKYFSFQYSKQHVLATSFYLKTKLWGYRLKQKAAKEFQTLDSR